MIIVSVAWQTSKHLSSQTQKFQFDSEKQNSEHRKLKGIFSIYFVKVFLPTQVLEKISILETRSRTKTI